MSEVVKRGRGRPRKNAAEIVAGAVSSVGAATSFTTSLPSTTKVEVETNQINANTSKDQLQEGPKLRTRKQKRANWEYVPISNGAESAETKKDEEPSPDVERTNSGRVKRLSMRMANSALKQTFVNKRRSSAKQKETVEGEKNEPILNDDDKEGDGNEEEEETASSSSTTHGGDHPGPSNSTMQMEVSNEAKPCHSQHDGEVFEAKAACTTSGQGLPQLEEEKEGWEKDSAVGPSLTNCMPERTYEAAEDGEVGQRGDEVDTELGNLTLSLSPTGSERNRSIFPPSPRARKEENSQLYTPSQLTASNNSSTNPTNNNSADVAAMASGALIGEELALEPSDSSQPSSPRGNDYSVAVVAESIHSIFAPDDLLSVENGTSSDEAKRANGDGAGSTQGIKNGCEAADLCCGIENEEDGEIATESPPQEEEEENKAPISSSATTIDPLKTFTLIEENISYCADGKSDDFNLPCNCDPSPKDLKAGRGCGSSCLNRQLYMECSGRCPSGKRCTNKRFQRRQYANVEVFDAGEKGFGLRAKSRIAKGAFIIEYQGEVVNNEEMIRRIKRYGRDPTHRHHYLMALRGGAVIDATTKGNISRFINHGCEPNAETQKWTVRGQLRIGFFALREIEDGEEVNFNYQFERYGKQAQRCLCNAKSCTGYIGAASPEQQGSGSEGESSFSSSSDENDDGTPTIVAPSRLPKRPKCQSKPSKAKQAATPQRQRQRRVVADAKALFERKKAAEAVEVSALLAKRLRTREHLLAFNRLMVRAEQLDSNRRMVEHLLEYERNSDILRLFVGIQGVALLGIWTRKLLGAFQSPPSPSTSITINGSEQPSLAGGAPTPTLALTEEGLQMMVNITRLYLRLPVTNRKQVEASEVTLEHLRIAEPPVELIAADLLNSLVTEVAAACPIGNAGVEDGVKQKECEPSLLTSFPQLTQLQLIDELKRNASTLLERWNQLSEFKIPKKLQPPQDPRRYGITCGNSEDMACVNEQESEQMPCPKEMGNGEKSEPAGPSEYSDMNDTEPFGNSGFRVPFYSQQQQQPYQQQPYQQQYGRFQRGRGKFPLRARGMPGPRGGRFPFASRGGPCRPHFQQQCSSANEEEHRQEESNEGNGDGSAFDGSKPNGGNGEENGNYNNHDNYTNNYRRSLPNASSSCLPARSFHQRAGNYHKEKHRRFYGRTSKPIIFPRRMRDDEEDPSRRSHHDVEENSDDENDGAVVVKKRHKQRNPDRHSTNKTKKRHSSDDSKGSRRKSRKKHHSSHKHRRHHHKRKHRSGRHRSSTSPSSRSRSRAGKKSSKESKRRRKSKHHSRRDESVGSSRSSSRSNSRSSRSSSADSSVSSQYSTASANRRGNGERRVKTTIKEHHSSRRKEAAPRASPRPFSSTRQRCRSASTSCSNDEASSLLPKSLPAAKQLAYNNRLQQQYPPTSSSHEQYESTGFGPNNASSQVSLTAAVNPQLPFTTSQPPLPASICSTAFAPRAGTAAGTSEKRYETAEHADDPLAKSKAIAERLKLQSNLQPMLAMEKKLEAAGLLSSVKNSPSPQQVGPEQQRQHDFPRSRLASLSSLHSTPDASSPTIAREQLSTQSPSPLTRLVSPTTKVSVGREELQKGKAWEGRSSGSPSVSSTPVSVKSVLLSRPPLEGPKFLKENVNEFLPSSAAARDGRGEQQDGEAREIERTAKFIGEIKKWLADWELYEYGLKSSAMRVTSSSQVDTDSVGSPKGRFLSTFATVGASASSSGGGDATAASSSRRSGLQRGKQHQGNPLDLEEGGALAPKRRRLHDSAATACSSSSASSSCSTGFATTTSTTPPEDPIISAKMPFPLSAAPISNSTAAAVSKKGVLQSFPKVEEEAISPSPSLLSTQQSKAAKLLLTAAAHSKSDGLLLAATSNDSSRVAGVAAMDIVSKAAKSLADPRLLSRKDAPGAASLLWRPSSDTLAAVPAGTSQQQAPTAPAEESAKRKMTREEKLRRKMEKEQKRKMKKDPRVKGLTQEGRVTKKSAGKKKEKGPWLETKTKDGRTYYYHSITLERRWERPAEMGKEGVAGKEQKKNSSPPPTASLLGRVIKREPKSSPQGSGVDVELVPTKASSPLAIPTPSTSTCLVSSTPQRPSLTARQSNGPARTSEERSQPKATLTAICPSSTSSSNHNDEETTRLRAEFKAGVVKFTSNYLKPYKNQYFPLSDEYSAFLRKITHKVIDYYENVDLPSFDSPKVQEATRHLLDNYMKTLTKSRVEKQVQRQQQQNPQVPVPTEGESKQE